eukprot:CAMPEP_0198287346 /NCGR_PEP_ID=MMETSP1449-20131203/6200_1 /TAXON_ID=420275 /ORGANISM="Attheya septentrionalis, Strain CCMP2084" /LENGTH=894 /DNA_ID=CAMNT_0043985293 /DNA_START=206 /DNA_END=2890 /DNA_ORIENTATION=-
MSSFENSHGGSSRVLRDSSARQNRRMSLGSSLSQSSDDPKKDRRALLDEWRKQARARESPSTSTSSSNDEEKESKRPRIQQQQNETPPLHHSLQTSDFSRGSPGGLEGVSSAVSAVERFRIRRQQRQQGEHDENRGPSLPPCPPSTSSNMCFADSDETSNSSRSSRTATTPLLKKNRRLSISTAKRSDRRRSMSAAPMSRGRKSLLAPEDDGPATEKSETRQVIQVDKKENYDSVEGAGLRSRVQEMQQRITQLEKEKMALSMSKAPLEARFRQKEDTWLKEQKRFIQEIESLKSSSKEADERFRDLELRYDALEEESKTLRFDARKAASTLNSQSDSTDNWSRQLQNDRDVLELKEKLRYAEYEIRALKLEKVSIESEVSATKMELDSLIRNYDELQAEFDDLEASKSQNSEAEIKLELLTTEHIATAGQLNAVCADFAATKSSAAAAMESKEKEWKAEAKKLKFEISVLKTRSAKIEDSELSMLQDGVEDDAVLKARIEERDARIAELETQLLKVEQIRRSMHNRIQELRGNIRVFVRTRPFLFGDGQSNESSIEDLPDGESLSIADTRNNDSHGFKFDKVFPPSAGQDSVFNEVSEFVQSALDGYNVCLFSYGQTGSGKTHTMQGSGNGAMRGIIPRAVEQILVQAQLMQKQKWQFSITASFLEIYNEELRDLLGSAKSGSSSSASSRTNSSAKLAIKRNANGKSFVHGLTHIKIETNDSSVGMDQLESVMETAARARSVASTKMNAQSSRSHSVFMLHLRGQNEDDGTVVEGALNLCDLAGSERLDRSGAGTNQVRLRETQAINKSLSCLGDVFTSLSNGSSHIPYRNSKLTYLLQDCLSGDGKALMFVNLSPTIESSNESLCSLRFAKRVNQVELGKATKHVQYSGGKR